MRHARLSPSSSLPYVTSTAAVKENNNKAYEQEWSHDKQQGNSDIAHAYVHNLWIALPGVQLANAVLHNLVQRFCNLQVEDGNIDAAPVRFGNCTTEKPSSSECVQALFGLEDCQILARVSRNELVFSYCLHRIQKRGKKTACQIDEQMP